MKEDHNKSPETNPSYKQTIAANKQTDKLADKTRKISRRKKNNKSAEIKILSQVVRLGEGGKTFFG